MRVLNVSDNDWANFAYDNMMSLRSVGIDCISLVLNSHPFGYKDTSIRVDRKLMEKLMKKADMVQAFHSPQNLIPLLQDCKKPVVVYHTGTGYRQAPATMHEAFKGFSIVCALPELYLDSKQRGADPVYIVGGIAIPEKVSFDTSNPIRIGHYPSNPEVKGTETLRPLLSKYGADIRTDKVAYNIQLYRLEDCDVYVEMMATLQGKADYGSFGITALEAAARGKIVLTNCVHSEVYREHYGKEPFIFCNDLHSLEEKLDYLLDLEDITALKKELHERFVKLHSHASTGKYLKDNVLKRIL